MMNAILKYKMKEMKEKEIDIAHQFNLTETKITMAEEHINQSKEKSKMSKTALEKKIEKNKKDIEELNTQALSLMSEVVDWRDSVLPKEQSFKREQSDFIGVRVKLDDNSKRMEKEIDFFKENDDCPTCEQPIDDEFKEKAIEKRTDKMMTNTCALVRMDEQISEMNAREGLYSKISNDVRDKEVESAKKTTSASSILSFNEQLTDQINDLLSVDADLVEEKTKLKLYRDELETIQKQKNKLTEDNNYLTLAKQLLNDSGIKTKVVKRYLPVMNKLINSYLSALEFQVKFELDEQFNETIKSRYRDVFGYANFSEGEKMRIDLALLFTWRQIAKMKNSTNTNLLILDEIFDSSLDYNGTDEFLKILSTLSNEICFYNFT